MERSNIISVASKEGLDRGISSDPSLRLCPVCKMGFTPKIKYQKLCSPKCRLADGRIRNEKWRKNNREELLKRKKEYRIKSKDTIKNYNQRYYQEKKEEFYRKNRDWKNAYGRKYLESWVGFLPTETTCQVCGKTIYFNKRDIKLSIHFDHRFEGNETIKGTPFSWLFQHPYTPQNEKIWESCGFGMLCNKCNLSLPTKNRKQFLINAIKYMGFTEKEIFGEK